MKIHGKTIAWKWVKKMREKQCSEVNGGNAFHPMLQQDHRNQSQILLTLDNLWQYSGFKSMAPLWDLAM